MKIKTKNILKGHFIKKMNICKEALIFMKMYLKYQGIDIHTGKVTSI